jgi:threonine synthase
LNWEVPDWLFIPVGGGGLLAGNWKGFKEFETLGFISSLPKIVAVQSTGCAPLVRAYEQGRDPFDIEPWGKPETIATGLEDPFPWDGDAALRAIRESRGTAVSVTNEEILEAQKLLAKEEGIFAEPSGVASLAGLMKLLDEGIIGSGDLVVVEITGSGLKDPDVISEHLGLPPVIEPRIEVVDSYLKKLGI